MTVGNGGDIIKKPEVIADALENSKIRRLKQGMDCDGRTPFGRGQLYLTFFLPIFKRADDRAEAWCGKKLYPDCDRRIQP